MCRRRQEGVYTSYTYGPAGKQIKVTCICKQVVHAHLAVSSLASIMVGEIVSL